MLFAMPCAPCRSRTRCAIQYITVTRTSHLLFEETRGALDVLTQPATFALMERTPFAALQAATRARLRARDGRAVVYFVDINIAAVESVVAEYVIGAMLRACPCGIDYEVGSAMRTYTQVANAYVL